ncbi:MAG: hypothetical protein WC047_05715 [Kiritimatiellales bacterium]
MKLASKLFKSLLLLSTILLTVSCDSNNQVKLIKKANTTEKVSVFINCCSKIKDQTLLCDLVLSNPKWGIRRTALDFITNKDCLNKIVTESEDLDIQDFAKQRLMAISTGQSVDKVPKIHWYVIRPDGSLGDAHTTKSATWDKVLASFK